MQKRCPYCATKIADTQGLCSTCHTGIVKYPDQNQVIITAYVLAGFADLDHFLDRHNEFTSWLINHGGTP